MTVLIVEDDKDIIDLIEDNLSDLGFKVDKATSAEEALEMINRQKYNTYFIDIILPGMDGIELTKKIITEDKTAKIAVMTGGGEGVEIVNQILLDAAVGKGALHSLAKPFTFEDIKELVEHFESIN